MACWGASGVGGCGVTDPRSTPLRERGALLSRRSQLVTVLGAPGDVRCSLLFGLRISSSVCLTWGVHVGLGGGPGARRAAGARARALRARQDRAASLAGGLCGRFLCPARPWSVGGGFGEKCKVGGLYGT